MSKKIFRKIHKNIFFFCAKNFEIIKKFKKMVFLYSKKSKKFVQTYKFFTEGVGGYKNFIKKVAQIV